MMNLLPMCACSTRHLMIGKNPLWCSRQHGHSVQVMYERYGTWIEGATEADIEAIKRAMTAEAVAAEHKGLRVPARTLPSPELVAKRRMGSSQLEKNKAFQQLNWRSGRDSNEARLANQQLTDVTRIPSPSDPPESPSWSLVETNRYIGFPQSLSEKLHEGDHRSRALVYGPSALAENSSRV